MIKKILVFSVLFSFLLSYFLASEVKNTDTPSKGEFTFKLQEVWELKEAGADIFADIRQVSITEDDDTIYVYDGTNMKYFIFTSGGKFINAFGRKGEGPGEIKNIEQAPLFLGGDKVIIQDTGRLHYFDRKGKYLKSVVNDANLREPFFFLNENEFITAPRTKDDVTGGQAKIFKVNLKTGKTVDVFDFSVFKGAVVEQGNVRATVVTPSLTPMIIINHYKNRLYFGMNDVYKINITDMNGKVINEFGLTRKKGTVSEKVKVDVLIKEAQGRAPKEMLVYLAKQMPSELTCFSNIEVHNDLIYVYMSYYERKNSWQLDIFSQEGKYLYRSFIKMPEGIVIDEIPVIHKEHIYLVLEDEEGELSVVKCKIPLPKN